MAARIVLFLLVSVWVLPAMADEIVLDNGDRITGKVAGSSDGVLTIKPDYSEAVQVKIERIRDIKSDEPVELRLNSGEILKGRLTMSDGVLAVATETQKDLAVIGWGNLSAINPPPVAWHGNITIGAGEQSGNTDNASVTVAADAVRRSANDRFSMNVLYNYAEEEEEITTRNTYGTLKYDYFLSKRAFLYVGIELLNDRFKDLNMRTVVGPGAGYQIWEDAVKSLQFEAGVSYFSEDLDEGEDDQWASGRLTMRLRYNLMNAIVFSDYLLFYPKMGNGDASNVLRNEASIASPLGAGWSMKLTNIIEHDDNPPDGVENQDTYWILGLQYTF